MKNLPWLLLTVLLLTSASATAKTRLPLDISVEGQGSGAARVVVKFLAAAEDVIVSVGGFGSVQLPRETVLREQVNSNGEVELNVRYTNSSGVGGLALHIQGDFGRGRQVEVRTIDLVKADRSSKRATGAPAQAVIVVPSRTTVAP